MKQTLDDSGLGMAMIILGLSLIGCIIFYICLTPVMNVFTTIASSWVGSGNHVSQQTIGTFSFIMAIFTLVPVIIALGYFAKGLLIANYEKENQRGGVM